MTDTNMAAIRAAAQALVHQAELIGVVVTIETVPNTPLAMGNYYMQARVRAGRGPRPHSSPCGAGGLTEQDAGLLEQGASMLEALANDERNRGHDSSAAGAECSADAVRRLTMAVIATEATADAGFTAGDMADGAAKAFRNGQAGAAPDLRPGIEAAALWVDKRRQAFDNAHGSIDPETGALEFGRGSRANRQEDYSSELAEIAEGLRALIGDSKDGAA